MTNEEFFHQTCELLQVCTLDQEEYFEVFNSVISRPNYEVIEILKTLKNTNSYKLLALSNINESHANYLKMMKWNFLDMFDELIFSYQIKMTKPDPRVFHYAIEKAGCNPDEILFIDARNMGKMIDRRHRELTTEDIRKISDTYHAWRGERGEYEDVLGFCKSATLDEIREHDHILTPSRYVGFEEKEDEGIPFDEKMRELTSQFKEQMEKGKMLDEEIKNNLGRIGYSV